MCATVESRIGFGIPLVHRWLQDDAIEAALNAELHLKYCPALDVVRRCRVIPAGVGIIFDYNSAEKLDISASRDHPEFLLRLLRLIELQHAQGDCESDGLCILVKNVLDRVHAVNQQ